MFNRIVIFIVLILLSLGLYAEDNVQEIFSSMYEEIRNNEVRWMENIESSLESRVDIGYFQTENITSIDLFIEVRVFEPEAEIKYLILQKKNSDVWLIAQIAVVISEDVPEAFRYERIDVCKYYFKFSSGTIYEYDYKFFGNTIFTDDGEYPYYDEEVMTEYNRKDDIPYIVFLAEQNSDRMGK